MQHPLHRWRNKFLGGLSINIAHEVWRNKFNHTHQAYSSIYMNQNMGGWVGGGGGLQPQSPSMGFTAYAL